MATHLVVFASIRLIPIISNIEVDHVATGIMNSIGNKGGIGISFNVGETSLLFVNCHLAAGEEEKNDKRRTQDFINIDKNLNLPSKYNVKKEKENIKSRDVTFVSNRFDC